MVSAFVLVLLLLEFNILPSVFYLELTKKPNMDAFVQVQKYIQLMKNSIFSYNNITN